MRCPKCQFDHELQTTECLKCGIVFARYEAAQKAAANRPAPLGPVPPGSAPEPLAFPAPVQSGASPKPPAPLSPVPPGTSPKPRAFIAPGRPGPALKLPAALAPAPSQDARQELIYRAVALPLALLGARLVVGTGLRMAVRMLTMVLHESGHAITCWLTGRWAVPMLWVTMHGDERSVAIGLTVTAALGFAGYRAWEARRWVWVVFAGVVLIIQLLCLTAWRINADSIIVFFGDGGALVLATILMALFYSDRESVLYKSWGLRWGLLAIGAVAFMDVYATWSGPLGDLPFGEIEGVNLSDPTLLTEMYGWSILLMVDCYLRLARFCLMALAVVYTWGLISTYQEMRSPAPRAETIETA
jgi:hypothetical protein